MKHTRTPHRSARRLLLAAAMLPLTPLAAQDAAAPVEAPPVTITPPDAPAPATSPSSATPVQPALRNGVPVGGTPAADPAPAEEAAAADEPAARPARTARRATQRAAERPQVRARASAPAPDPAPQPAAEPAPAVTEAPPAEAPVAPLAAAPATAAPEPAPVESAPPAEDRIGLADTWPLLAAGLLAIGGLVMLLLRRRRRRLEDAEMEQAYYHEASVHHETPLAAEPALAAAPTMAAPLAHANDEHHHMASAPAAAAATAGVAANGRPWLELMMRPVRAGVGDEDARVEFELTVANQGSAPARDVRVSTFMLAGGSSDMEQSLIDGPAEPQLAERELDPGDGRSIESAVAMPRENLRDSILPVVVADARYRLPDGSEGRTSARFAVGVPVDGDLAHFDVENPSGLHERVEARLEREPEQV